MIQDIENFKPWPEDLEVKGGDLSKETNGKDSSAHNEG